MVYRDQVDDYKLVCPRCYEVDYAMARSTTNDEWHVGGSGSLRSLVGGFGIGLDHFGGLDGTVAPFWLLEEVLSHVTRVPESFSESGIRAFLEKRNKIYKRCAKKIMDIMLAVHAFRDSNVTNVIQARSVLKGLGLSEHYKIAPKILRLSDSERSRVFSPIQEERIMEMFLQIRDTTKEVSDGKTYLPRYSYLLYKICDLLGYKEFLQDFALPTGKSLVKNEARWKQICQKCDLDYRSLLT